MVEYTFSRNPSWSTATAIDRLETKLRRVRERAAVVASQRAALEAEAVASVRFERELVERLAAERRKGERRRSQGTLDLPPALVPDVPSFVGPKDVESPWVPTVRSTSVHTGPRRYDSSTKVFSPIVLDGVGSRQPIRPVLTPDASGDADILRLLSVIETPGLMHFMIMSEKAQADCRVEDVAVVEAALGLPLSEAFIDHVFSVEIIPIFSDPARALAHLAKIEAASQSRGDL